MDREPNTPGRMVRVVVDGVGVAAGLLWRSAVIVRGNLSLAVLSVALALSLWLYVSDAENPPRTEPLPFMLPAEAENLPDHLALLQPLPLVQLTVRAPEDTWDDLRPEDFRVVANLGGMEAGENQEVTLTVVKSPEGVFISRISPSVAAVTLEPKITKEVPVEITVEGSPPVGYELGSVTTEPPITTVEVSGPASQVREVVQAEGVISAQGRTVNIDEDVPLRPVNSTGNIAGNVTLEPDVVHVRVPVEQTELSKVVGVQVALRGQVASGYMITGIEPDPRLVEVRGTREELESVDHILTEEVDVTGATSDVVRTVRLSVPTSISATETESVNVRIGVAPQEVERALVVAPEVQGVRPGLQATVSTESVQVVVRGTASQVTALTLDDVRVVADVTGLGAGTHLVDAQASAPNGIQVVDVQPQQVEVTLSQ